MAQRFCPKCGAPLQFSSQKFCTTCGAAVPEPVPAPGAATGAGHSIPVWAVVIVGLLILGAAAMLVYPVITGGTPSSGSDGSTGALSLQPSPSLTPAYGITAVGTTTVPATSVSTVTTPITPSPTTAKTTKVTATTRKPTAKPTATEPTLTTEPEQTSVITESVTQVPPQPPVSSYTSTTPRAPYIDPAALEAKIHELTNVQREKNGLSTLTYDTPRT